MFKLFDFLYFAIYKWYAEWNDDNPEFAGSCAVSGFQSFNITSIIWVYGYFFNGGELYFSKLFGILLMISLIILNYIRYIRISRFSKDSIRTKWRSKSSAYQQKFRVCLIIYITLSLILFIGLIIYSARKKM